MQVKFVLQVYPVKFYYCGLSELPETFNAFLFCVGDMSEENLSLSTVSQNGKILILDGENIMNPLDYDEENKETINNFRSLWIKNLGIL